MQTENAKARHDGRTERTIESDAGELAARAPNHARRGGRWPTGGLTVRRAGTPTSAGRDGEFGDGSYGWLYEDCAGDLALAEYAVGDVEEGSR